jgi:hypothetical protein
MIIYIFIGPLFALILLQIPDKNYFDFRFNKFTYPGWFCAIIWIIYGIFLSINFLDKLKINEFSDIEIENNIAKENIINELEIDKNKDKDKGKFKEKIDYFNLDNELNTNINKSNEDIKNFSFSSNLIEYDINNLIREQDESFSYMSISFVILILILFLIRVLILK